MTVPAAPPMPTKDPRFLNGIDLDSPASIGRSIAMQIRTVGHYQGNPFNPGSSHTACVVASSAYAAASEPQRQRFERVLRERLGLKANAVATCWSLIEWNDSTETADVIKELESIPLDAK